MANIIAVVWDFDKTLVNGYMQNPIFERFKIDSHKFWEEVNLLPDKYKSEQNVRVNPETIYLNHFIKYAQEGIFKGLNNEMLTSFGKDLKFYPGIPDIFAKTKEKIESNDVFKEFDIKVEHYIVSTGMAAIIKGSSVMDFVEDIWGCELIEAPDKDDNMIISEVGYTIDNTSKTRALFEINKGVSKSDGVVDVNSNVPEPLRRVHFENMIYIADGPSDIPAFSVVNKNGGSTFAIYPKGDMIALKQVESMRKDGRVNMYAEADYSEGTTSFMWISNKIEELAQKIIKRERERLYSSVSTAPTHLI